jgi:16S rRNA (guanine527-N7)-methyltransferase
MDVSSKLGTYFPWLEAPQHQQLMDLFQLYKDWNSKINVISRKDMDNFFVHHVLHSLSIAKIIKFKDSTSVLDAGTGGGFPGIPLAIAFPKCQFTLVDSIAKKIRVVQGVAETLGLENVNSLAMRIESVEGKFDFVVSRAVTALPDFLKLVKGKIKSEGVNQLQNGILYLKGGEFPDELQQINMKHRIFKLSDIYQESFFETKKIVHLY